MPKRITGITAAQRARFPEWREKYNRLMLSCEEIDRPRTEAAIRGLYRVAGLDDRVRVIFVPSPLVAVLAGCFSSVIWWRRSGGDVAASVATDAATRAATRAATDAATLAATLAATDAATDAATRAATDAATDAATLAATHAATHAATLAATLAATRVAILAATDAATRAATDAATRAADALVWMMLDHCRHWYDYYNGGNQWSAWISDLTFLRDVCGLELPQHEAFQFYEDALTCGGPRFMHREFCFVSERPRHIKTILRDDVHVPHCEDGPSHLWNDDWACWHVNGVRVDEQIVMRPETQTAEQIRREPNAEIKRIRLERFGWERYLTAVGAAVVDTRRNDIETSREALMRTPDGETVLVCRCPSTHKVFPLEVPAEIQSCEAAQDWLNGGLSHYFTGRA